MLSISPKDFKPSIKIYSQIFKIGIPASLSFFLNSFTFSLAYKLVSQYGDEAVAGYGVCQRIMGMCTGLLKGVSQGYQPFAGYNYGARQYKRLRSGLKVTMVYNISLGIFFTIFFMIFGRAMVALFITNDPIALVRGVTFVKALALAMPFVGIQMMLAGTFQATGKAIRSLIITLGRQVIVFLPLIVIFNKLFGFQGLVYAQPSAEITSTLMAAGLAISLFKEMSAMNLKESLIS